MLRKFRVSSSRKFIRAGQFGQGAWKFIPAGRSAFAYPAQNVRAMLRAAAAACTQTTLALALVGVITIPAAIESYVAGYQTLW